MKNWTWPLLGFRLVILSVVAGSAVFLPAAFEARGAILAGIFAAIVLAAAQQLSTRHWKWIPGEAFILGHVAVWTYLTHVSKILYSPLFIGYLLEVPLAAMQLGRRGIVLAATAGAIAYVTYGAIVHPPVDLRMAALAVGFLAANAVLSWILVEVIERQQAAIESSYMVLSARAQNLAEELRLLGDYLQGGFVIIDDLGRIESINPAAVRACGLDGAMALGRPWQDVLRTNSIGTQAITRTLAEGTVQRGVDMTLEQPDGRRVSARAEMWVGAAERGRKTYVLFDAHAPGADEIDPLRRLGEAVACVSHQIKNSIHALDGLAGAVEQEIGAEERSAVRELRAALHDLGSLAGNTLAMSGASRALAEWVPLGEILSSALVLSRRVGVRVQVANASPQLVVRGHRGELVHALFNLLDNASRVSPAGAVVRVHVHADGAHAETEIEDSGPGLPAEFEHASGRVSSSNGSGYGLLAARRFIEAAGGELSFERMTAGGTRCRIRLSAADLESRVAPARLGHAPGLVQGA